MPIYVASTSAVLRVLLLLPLLQLQLSWTTPTATAGTPTDEQFTHCLGTPAISFNDKSKNSNNNSTKNHNINSKSNSHSNGVLFLWFNLAPAQ